MPLQVLQGVSLPSSSFSILVLLQVGHSKGMYPISPGVYGYFPTPEHNLHSGDPPQLHRMSFAMEIPFDRSGGAALIGCPIDFPDLT